MMKNIDTDEMTRMHAQNVPLDVIAREFGLDVESVEYILDRAYLRWAAQYGYDN